MQKKINIRVGECAMNPDATQPNTSIIFSLSETQKLFLLFFYCLFFFLYVSGFHFSYAFCIFSFLNWLHNDDWVLLCLSVILFHHYPKFFPIETVWSAVLNPVLNPVTPASVAQLNSIFWLYSLFSVGGIFTLLVFSSAERDLSRGWRLWGIHISAEKERFISLFLPRIPMPLAWMFAHLFFHVSPFLPSHISISLVKHADWGQLLGTDYKLGMWLAAFPFGAFRMLLSRSMRKTSVTQERS